ncbi:MAG TPA: GntR family transcriptional regulator, partial [Ilumatobacteraceae bacterium]|nr:GntR family transcriptional regulator [Ilumatobacteraceae bacterium]
MTTPVEPPLRAMTHAGRRRPRTRRVAESLADDLRSEILGGELTEVPRLDVLLERFDVGPPAAREAMRILETEGLITVRRGNQGGADVHLPQADQVAYSIAMV